MIKKFGWYQHDYIGLFGICSLGDFFVVVVWGPFFGVFFFFGGVALVWFFRLVFFFLRFH